MNAVTTQKKKYSARTVLIGVAIFAFALVATSLYACSSPAPVSDKDAKDSPQSSITITLPSQAGTGYTWGYTVSPEGALLEASHETKALDNLAGGNMEDIFVLKAAKSGDATLQFKLARSWEEKETPAETAEYQLSIDENMNITVQAADASVENIKDPVLSE